VGLIFVAALFLSGKISDSPLNTYFKARIFSGFRGTLGLEKKFSPVSAEYAF